MTTTQPDSIPRPPFDEEGASFHLLDIMTKESINMTEMVALQPSVKFRTPIIMCTLGVTGNLIAICVYYTSHKIYRRLMFYRLLLGMFWTNILGYITTYPLMFMAFEAGLNWRGDTATCKFHGFSMLSFGLACSYITGTLAMERFLSICRPITHAYKMERRKAPWTIGLLWIMSAFGAMLPILGFGGVQLMYPNTWCFLNWRNEETVAKLYACVAASMIIGMVGVVSGCAVLCTLVLIHFRLKPPNRRPYPVDERDVTGKVRLKMQLERKYEVWVLAQFDMLAAIFVTCFLPMGDHPNTMCERAVGVECRTIDGQPYTNTADKNLICAPNIGFVCNIQKSGRNACTSYKVRFLCEDAKGKFPPSSESKTWTKWFNSDTPADGDDKENAKDLYSKYPKDMCEKPSGVECRTADGRPWYSTGDKLTCGAKLGLVCKKEKNGHNCSDYKVRFLCPDVIWRLYK